MGYVTNLRCFVFLVSMPHTYTSTPLSCSTTLFSHLYPSLPSEVSPNCLREISETDCGCIVAFDQDINAKAAMAFPQLYISGIRGLEYTRLKFWLYMIDGMYQSAVVFFIPYIVWTWGVVSSTNGKSIESLADFGTTVSVAAIFSANTYVGMNTH